MTGLYFILQILESRLGNVFRLAPWYLILISPFANDNAPLTRFESPVKSLILSRSSTAKWLSYKYVVVEKLSWDRNQLPNIYRGNEVSRWAVNLTKNRRLSVKDSTDQYGSCLLLEAQRYKRYTYLLDGNVFSHWIWSSSFIINFILYLFNLSSRLKVV